MKFSALISVLFITLFFAACSSDENETEQDIPASSDGDAISQDEDFQENDSDSNQVNEEPDEDKDSAQTDEEPAEPDDESESLIDLSSTETANCYIVKTAGKYSFDATVRGNGKRVEGVDFAEEKLTPASAKLVWQSDKNSLLDLLELKDGRIYFTSRGRSGNALIAALDEAGKIIWSWHIWFLGEEISELKTSGGVMVMDRNLGATSLDPESPESHGLLYQWGRKEPFPASPVVSGGTTSTMPVPVYDMEGNEVAIQASSRENGENNTLEYALSHPTTVLSNNSQYSECRDWLRKEFSNPALWGGTDGEKSLFDPCPATYRVPKIGTFDFFTSSGGYETDIAGFSVYDINTDGVTNENDYKNGWYILLDSTSDSYSYFPAAARYDGSYAMLMGSKVGLWGNYWYADAAGDAEDSFVPCGAYALAFQFGEEISASPKAVGGRADAYSVRCMKE
jgi:Cobalamin biosynthesis protein CobT (nicotinate-mononucleotide:5, 6-dimethylbenzimidazole phosphoribosyltransferase)